MLRSFISWMNFFAIDKLSWITILCKPLLKHYYIMCLLWICMNVVGRFSDLHFVEPSNLSHKMIGWGSTFCFWVCISNNSTTYGQEITFLAISLLKSFYNKILVKFSEAACHHIVPSVILKPKCYKWSVPKGLRNQFLAS